MRWLTRLQSVVSNAAFQRGGSAGGRFSRGRLSLDASSLSQLRFLSVRAGDSKAKTNVTASAKRSTKENETGGDDNDSTILEKRTKIPTEVPIPLKRRSKKGSGREHKRRATERSDENPICAAYSATADLNVYKLQKLLRSKRLIQETFQTFGQDAIGCSVTKPSGGGYVFLFPSGSLVFWDVPIVTRRQVFLEASVLGEARIIVPFNEFDHEFEFMIDSKRTFFRGDLIHVKNINEKEELLAISLGLAQSAKLQIYEEAVDQLVEETQELPSQLAKFGRIYMSQNTLRRRLGRLLTARYSVSLLSDILDTPDFFWEHSDLEELYSQCLAEISLNRRIQVLSSRMDIIRESLDMINTELAQTNTHRVELYILSLIAIEVVIELGKLYFGR